MHRCLYIQEILLNIFEILNHPSTYPPEAFEPNWTPVRTHALTALARTCKTFTYPAVKIIWRDLPGLHTLSYLMADSMFEIEDHCCVVSVP
jgi:hypothetical protein